MHFDLGRNEVIEVIDHGPVSLPQQHARYFPADHEPLRTDLKPLEITQPEGPSFTVDGNLVRWGRWSLRIGFDPHEGVVLHQVTYDDHGRERTILHRASVSEMVVPYGDPGPLHGWKNAFDAGEWGLGRMTQSLTLGCDCLGEIHYFDAVLASETGDPYTIENAICLHEEDYGILWKHVDLFSGTSEVRRSRRLVVNAVSTVGNYEYGFSWYLYLDGNIQLEVKLTGIVSPMAIEPGTTSEFANVIAPGIAAPHHQHLFNVRLDFDLDGTDNEVYEVEAETVPYGPDNPWGNAFRPTVTRLETETAAQREDELGHEPELEGREPARHERARPAGGLQARPDDEHADAARAPGLERRQARRVRAAEPLGHAVLTPTSDARPASTRTSTRVATGSRAGPRQDRNLVDTDIVLWYTFGVTHFVRPEDWPVMPVEYAGFLLTPNGFFDRNPALDLPPSTNGHCH